MRIDLTGKVAIITGAGRGIGKQIALLAAEGGAKVVLASRSSDELDAVAAQVEAAGGQAVPIPTDMLDADAQTRLVSQTLDRFGRIDILVNNAAGNLIGNLIMSKEKDWRELYDLNVFSLFRMTKAVARHMIRQKSGRIINIASVAAKMGAAYNSGYSSSKAAVIAFTKSIARELAPIGITANSVCPWHVDTELVRYGMGKRGKMFGKDAETYLQEIADTNPQKRLMQPREVAAMVVFLMGDDAQAINGQSINVDGGMVME